MVKKMKKPKRDTIQQLEDLKSWSQNPKEYYKKNPEMIPLSQQEDRPFELEAFVKSEDPVPRKMVAGIKDTTLYKTLKDPRVIGLDLGHDSIMEIINLIQNSGLVKKQTQSENLYAKKNDQRNTMETMYQSMTPIERGQFNFDLRKRYGQDYIRFRNNNKNIK
jgi:hypothetical protein